MRSWCFKSHCHLAFVAQACSRADYDSDIDLVVSTDKLNESNKVRLLAELSKAMRQAKITDVVAIIAKARVPIIKFVTLEGTLAKPRFLHGAELTVRQATSTWISR